jgi:hypothetical protein
MWNHGADAESGDGLSGFAGFFFFIALLLVASGTSSSESEELSFIAAVFVVAVGR